MWIGLDGLIGGLEGYVDRIGWIDRRLNCQHD